MMPFVLEEEQETKDSPTPSKGFQLLEKSEEKVTPHKSDKKGFQLLPEEEQPVIDPGWMTKAYRSTLGKYFDYVRKNDPKAKELIQKEGYKPPEPIKNKEFATFHLLNKLGPNYPEEIRENMLADLAKLNETDALFSEEGVKMMSPYVGEKHAKELLTEGPPKKQYKRDIGFSQAIREGQQESAFGILTGSGISYEDLLKRSESEIPFLKRQAKNLSKIIGDLPAMIVGGAIASLPAGGPETPWGAALAGAGAFGTLELIQNSYSEALRLVAENPKLEGKTLDQIVAIVSDPEALKNIGLSTLEGSALGALIAVNPLMKALEKTPLAKLFKVPLVKGATSVASEAATLTGVPAALRGQIPTAEDFLDNAVLIGGLKVSGATAAKLAKWAAKGKHTAEHVVSLLGDKITKDDEISLAATKTEEQFLNMLKDIQNRPDKEPVEPVKEKSVEPIETKEEQKPVKQTKALEPAKKIKEGKEPVSEPSAEQLETNDRQKLENKYKQLVKLEEKFIEENLGSKALLDWRVLNEFTFWEKWGEKLSEEKIDEFENLDKEGFPSSYYRMKLGEYKSIETSYYSGNNKKESITQFIGELRDKLIDHKNNKTFLNYAMNFLLDKGHSKEEIKKTILEVLSKDLNLYDAEYIAKDLFGDPVNKISFEKDIEISKVSEPSAKQLEMSDVNEPLKYNFGRGEFKEKDVSGTDPSIIYLFPDVNKPSASIAVNNVMKGIELTKSESHKLKEAGKEKFLDNVEKHDKLVEEVEESIRDRAWKMKKSQGRKKQETQDIEKSKQIPIKPEQKQLEPKIGTETNVPSKREIINVFRDAFKETPIRIGKFRQKALGFFDPTKNVIRLKEANMIEVAAHEFGHKLHYALFADSEAPVKTQRIQIRNALKPFMSELYPISRYAPHDREGFAEFTRMYVTRPESAQQLAPKFYKFFETEMQKKAPEVLKSLHEARDMHNRYLNADPVARTDAHIVSSFDRTLWQKTGDSLRKSFNLNRIKTEWLDETYPIKQAVAETLGIKPVDVENWISPLNAYTQVRVLKGWIGKAEVMIFHETFYANTLKKSGKSLNEILEPIKTDVERKELSAYLVDKRAQLLEKRGIKSGIDKNTVDETVKRLAPKYEKIAQEINDYQDRVLRYAVDSGVYSEKQYDQMKKLNPFYVPFYRVFEEGEKRLGKQTGGETGKLQAQQTLKQIFGSTREIIDPIESIIRNTMMIVQNSEKNRLGQTLSKLSQVHPRGGKFMEKVSPKQKKIFELQKAELIEEVKKEARRKDPSYELTNSDELAAEIAHDLLPDSINRWRATSWGPAENVVTVYFDGKPKYYETTPEIADLYKRGGMGKSFAPAFVKILSLPAKTLRTGAILSPKFIMKNPVRDLLGGYIFTKHTGEPIMDLLYRPMAGLAHAIKKDNVYIDWLKAGGGMATMQSIDKTTQQLHKNIGPKLLDKYGPIQLLRRASEVTEEANRIAEYQKAVEAMGTDRWQKEMAAFQSRDISIDYGKYGYFAKALNQIIPFWNTTIQGGDKLIRTLASSDPKVRQDFISRVTSGIILPSLALQIANGNDPDIEELPETTKDTNFIFKDPLSGNIIQIPVPFETGILFHGLTRRLYNTIIKKDPNAFEGFLGSITDAALPGFLPPFIKTPMEVKANKDFYTGRYIIHPSKLGLVSEEQYSTFTSQSARYIAKALSYMPGIDAMESSLASPDIVQHYITSWTAGLGRLVLSLADKALEVSGVESEIKKPEEDLLRQLGLDAFTKKYPQAKTKSVEKFWDTWQKWQKLEKSVKSKLDKNDIEGAQRLQNEMNKIAPPSIKDMHKAFNNIQKCINSIYRNPTMSAKEKRIELDALYLREIQMARAFMHEIERNKELEKHKKKG